MTYEDIAVMSPDEAEKTIRELLAIVTVVAIFGRGISKEIETAARKFL